MPHSNLCVIGAGNHSRGYHLPALARFLAEHPGEATVSGICDPDPARAAQAAQTFSGCRTYADVDAMLTHERPDACLVVTPMALNGSVARQVMRTGIPVLMEKPLGASLEEARELVRLSTLAAAGSMVSMNRRFDPLLARARHWIGQRKVRYVRATMARHNRTEPGFLVETGLHLIDVVRMVAGEVATWDAGMYPLGGVPWIQVRLQFASGAHGLVDFLPTAGGNTESLEFFGEGFRVEVQTGGFEGEGWRVWADGHLTVHESNPADAPDYITNGTYAETEAFMRGLQSGVFSPTPAEVLPGMELCYAINARLGWT